MKTDTCMLHHDSNMQRRSFLQLSGLAGFGLAAAGLGLVSSEVVKFSGKLYKVSRTELSMKTFVSMTLIHPSRDEAQEAMGNAFEEINRLVGLMNRFDEKSAVSHLNKESLIKKPPKEMAEVIKAAMKYNRLSRGAFDITVEPIIELYRKKFGQENVPPTESELRDALALVGSEKIVISENSIRFKTEGMRITLDGIAKGYIVDKASQVLSSYGVKNHLINAGGDLRAAGSKRDKKPWRVAVQDPKADGRFKEIIQMSDGAVATSGSYEVYFDRERMFHHLVDSRTGKSPRENISVTVFAPTVTSADALSTSVFIMDPTTGTGFINGLPGTECLVIGTNETVLKSDGWRKILV